jgi:preprotein translocase subunit SecY
MTWLKDIAATLSPGQPIYVILYAVAIVFFCFFYTALVFNSKETADNLKKSGAFVPGIRPGDQTSRYIDKILTRLTLAGAIYITVVCLAAGVPDFEVERSVLLRRHQLVDHRRRDDGLHVPGPGLRHVASV